MKHILIIVPFAAALILTNGCSEAGPKEYTSEVRKVSPTVESQVMQHADWTHRAVGYRVDLYDQSATGDLNGLIIDLPRLKELGVDYLILPPVFKAQIISDTLLHDFKAFTDFKQIDEDFGTLEDFQNLMIECHSRGMKVLLTWSSGQISVENQWVKEFSRLFNDTIESPAGSKYWEGVVTTDFENDTTFNLIAETWKFWLEEFDVDGFYCTASELVPTVFWERLRSEISTDRNQLLMAADRAMPKFHKEAFDMTATPRLHETLIEVSNGTFPPEAIDLFIQQHERDFPLNAFRELFATNNDLLARKGNLKDQFGEAHKLIGILMFTLPGMPVLYTGQESDQPIVNRPFETDSIGFGSAEHAQFYKTLAEAHHQNRALWAGLQGGRYERLTTAEDQSLFAFSRTEGDNRVVVILNFSDQPVDIDFQRSLDGTYQSIFNNEMLSIFTEGDVKLPPYGYQVFVK